jgi:hypothetical protein
MYLLLSPLILLVFKDNRKSSVKVPEVTIDAVRKDILLGHILLEELDEEVDIKFLLNI